MFLSSKPRLPPEAANKLIKENWAPHEAKVFEVSKTLPPGPIREVHNEHLDFGPSDTLYSTANKHRPRDALQRNPDEVIEELNNRLSVPSDFRTSPAEGDSQTAIVPGVPAPLLAMWRRSEMRTPLVVPCSISGLGSSDSVIQGIKRLAVCRSTTTVIVDLLSGTEEEVLKVAEEALNAGAWLIVVHTKAAPALCGDAPGFSLFRQLSLMLMTVVPTPDHFPQREIFRLWVVIPSPVDFNDTNHPVFPSVFSHQALQLSTVISQEDEGSKVVKQLPADPRMLEEELYYRHRRAVQGRDDDGESLEGDVIQNTCSPRKITGPLFIRSREVAMHTTPERQKERLDTVMRALC
eukprot:Sspe_Gene.57772::Locus_31704_Transcript_2_2_Confidence_0.800_Length_1930::g.57772::m.57772